MKRLVSGGAVADARDAQLAEQRQHRAGVKPLVGQAQRLPVLTRDDDRLTDVALAAGVHMRLQGQAHQLAGAAL